VKVSKLKRRFFQILVPAAYCLAAPAFIVWLIVVIGCVISVAPALLIEAHIHPEGWEDPEDA